MVVATTPKAMSSTDKESGMVRERKSQTTPADSKVSAAIATQCEDVIRRKLPPIRQNAAALFGRRGLS
tara:strand:+ start:272 stop:475 length:204 start_codon:yes stop_codon:yes gene_type:complete